MDIIVLVTIIGFVNHQSSQNGTDLQSYDPFTSLSQRQSLKMRTLMRSFRVGIKKSQWTNPYCTRFFGKDIRTSDLSPG